MPAPVRAAITGGPGAGKSTLLAELALRGVSTEPEVAREILRAPGGMALRDDDPARFGQAMFEAELAAYRRAESSDRITLFDRGFPDIAGFLTLEGLDVPDEIDRACRELRYEGPIFRAPPWREIYRPDEQRIQTWEQALASDRAVVDAWRRHGYDLVDLPLASVADRGRYVLEMLRNG